MVPLGSSAHPGKHPPAQEGLSLSPCNSQAMLSFQPPGERQSLQVGVPGPGRSFGPSPLQSPWHWLCPLLPAGMSCAAAAVLPPVPPTVPAAAHSW